MTKWDQVPWILPWDCQPSVNRNYTPAEKSATILSLYIHILYIDIEDRTSKSTCVYWPGSWGAYQTDLMAACGHCRRTSVKIQKLYKISMKKNLNWTPRRNLLWLSLCVRVMWEYLIKEGVVSPLDPCPVGLSTHINLHHRLDVVARQLTGLNDPHTNLKEMKFTDEHPILTRST